MRTTFQHDLFGGVDYWRNAPVRTQIVAGFCLGSLALLGVLNLLPHVLSGHPRAIAVDFTAFWAAGQAWGQGFSPYGPEYAAIIAESGAPALHAPPPPYFYPPNSILLALPFSALGYADASASFAIVNAAAFICAAWGFAAVVAKPADGARSLDVNSVRIRIIVLASIFVGVAGAVWTAAEVVFLHNTPAFAIYAAGFFSLAAIRDRKIGLLTVCLTITLMKPQLGAPLLLVALLSPSTRPAGLYAVAVTGCLAGAGLLAGAPGSLVDFLVNLTAYGDYPENAALNTSGAGHLIAVLVNLDISSFALLVALFAAQLVAHATADRDLRGAEDWPLRFAAFSLIAAAAILPSHNNYHLALAPAFFLIPATAREKALLAGAAIATMFAWQIGEALSAIGVFYLQRNAAMIDTISIAIILYAARTLVRGAAHSPKPISMQESVA